MRGKAIRGMERIGVQLNGSEWSGTEGKGEEKAWKFVVGQGDEGTGRDRIGIWEVRFGVVG